jgi:hypothetical protein
MPHFTTLSLATLALDDTRHFGLWSRQFIERPHYILPWWYGQWSHRQRAGTREWKGRRRRPPTHRVPWRNDILQMPPACLKLTNGTEAGHRIKSGSGVVPTNT